MAVRRSSGLIASIVAAGLTIQSASAADTSIQQMQQQVNALQAEVNQLKSQQQPVEVNEPQTMQQIISDADRHSQLMDTTGSFGGGWDPANYRFFIASDDGNFLFHPGFILQVRYASSYDSQPHNWDDGFEIRWRRCASSRNYSDCGTGDESLVSQLACDTN